MKKTIGIILCLYLSSLAWGLYLSHKHLYNAIVYLNANNTTQAVKELEKSIEQSPYQIIGLYYLSGLKSSQDPVEALWLYYRLEEKNPNFLLTPYFKSLQYRRLGLYKQAYEEILVAERLYPLNEKVQQEKNLYRIERGNDER